MILIKSVLSSRGCVYLIISNSGCFRGCTLNILNFFCVTCSVVVAFNSPSTVVVILGISHLVDVFCVVYVLVIYKIYI